MHVRERLEQTESLPYGRSRAGKDALRSPYNRLRLLGRVPRYAGTGKSVMLGVAREAWEAAGYRVQGAALSGIAAENLEGGSGISSRTIASLERQWAKDRELLDARDVLVIDEAGLIGSAIRIDGSHSSRQLR